MAVKIWKRFTPVWGNDDLSEGEKPWSVEVIIRPSLAVLKKVIEVSTMRVADEGAIEAMQEVFLLCVRKPKDLVLDLGTEGKREIDNDSLSEMADYLDPSLLDEVFSFINSERKRPSGEASPQSPGGDTTTPTDETAAIASDEAAAFTAPDDGAKQDEAATSSE